MRKYHRLLIKLCSLTLALSSASALLAGPNYLEPFGPQDLHFWLEEVSKALLGNAYAECSLVADPSLGWPYALRLRKEPLSPFRRAEGFGLDPVASNYARTHPSVSYQWFVESAEVVAIKQPPLNTLKFGQKLDVSVKRSHAEVSMALGKSMARGWESVVYLTRYSEDTNGGADGTRYFFSAGWRYYGQTWSPADGLPADLVNLAHQLKTLVEGVSENRIALENELLSRATKLEEATDLERKKVSSPVIPVK